MDMFRDICLNHGEKLQEKEFQELISVMDLDAQGDIEYDDFIKMLMAK